MFSGRDSVAPRTAIPSANCLPNFAHWLASGVDTGSTQLCPRVGITLAGYDRAQDCHGALAADVGEDVGPLPIHLRQSFRDGLHADAYASHQVLALPQVGAQHAKFFGRGESSGGVGRSVAASAALDIPGRHSCPRATSGYNARWSP